MMAKKLRMLMLFIMIETFTETQAYIPIPITITDSRKFLIHPGLVSENLQQPKFYEKLYPLVFQFNVTSYITSTLAKTNETLFPNEVPDDDYVSDQKLAGFLNEILESIKPKEVNRTKSSYCNEIGESFQGFFTEISALKDHFQHLRDCFSPDKQDTKYYLRAIDIPNSFPDFVLKTEYPQIHMLEEALEDCRNKRIPKSLLSCLDFEANFITASKNLAKGEWKTTLDGVNGDLNNYFYRPDLTDCTLSDGAMFVRVLIPVIKSSHAQTAQSLNLSKFKPIPFFNQVNDQDFICQVGGFNDMNYLVNTLDKIAFESNCKPGELCLFNENVISVGKISSCASATVKQSKEEFVKHCPFACKESTHFLERPIIQKFGKNEFLILGHISDKIAVQCNNKNATNQFLSTLVFPNTLTVELQIPCGCMIIKPSRIYELDGTCDPDVVETKSESLVPLAWLPNTGESGSDYSWYNLEARENFTLNVKANVYSNIEDGIWGNAKETRGVVVLNTVQNVAENHAVKYKADPASISISKWPFTITFMVFVFVTVLTCCLVSRGRRAPITVPFRGPPQQEYTASFHR